MASAYDAKIDGIYYNFSGTAATVTCYDSNCNSSAYSGSVIIPETVTYGSNTYSVTSIDVYAFRDCSKLTSVTIGESVTSIGDMAFKNCTGLTYAFIPNSITSIGSYAFQGCTGLTYVVLPSLGPSLENKNTFYSCNKIQDVIFLGDSQRNLRLSNVNYYTRKDFLTWNVDSYTYTGNAPSLPSYTNNLPRGLQPTKKGDVVLEKDAGTHTAYIPFNFKNSDMSFDVEVPYTYTINPVGLTARVKDTTREYGDANPAFESEYSGFVNGEDASVITDHGTYTTDATNKSDVGVYTVSQSDAVAQNYTFTYETGKMTVTKAALTMTANNKRMAYGDMLPNFDATYTGLKNSEAAPAWITEPTFVTTATQASSVGTYPISIQGADPKNYNITCVNGQLSIEKADVTMRANNISRLYGEENPELTLTYTGLKNGESEPVWKVSPVITTEATRTSPVGNYPIRVTEGVSQNYNITATNGTLTIGKAPLTIKPKDVSRRYGDENPTFQLEYTGLKNDESAPEWTDTPIVTTTATSASSVGDYPITIGAAEARNYQLQKCTGTLSVTKAALGISIENATRKYGENNPSFTLLYDGLVNGETAPTWTSRPTLTSTATKTSDVGKYAIKAEGGVMKNYEMPVIGDGELTITPASLRLKAKNASRLYYEENPTFAFSGSGFMNGETESVLTSQPQIGTSATKSSSAGTYPIEISGGAATNYNIEYENGTLTINKRSLSVSAKDCARAYNEENPTFELTYNGFIRNEDENVLTEKPVASTTASQTSDVGTYAIKVTGGNADNYSFSYNNGTLTINKAEQTIAWEQDLSTLNAGDQVELNAVASSGLPITYTTDNENAAEVYTIGSKSYLDCKASGQFLMRAMQEGNKNYYASPRISNIVTITGNAVNAPLLTISQADNGSVSIPVVYGNSYTLTIKAQTGWSIHTVTLNDEDVTDVLSSAGEYTTPAIVGNSTLRVVYEKTGGNAVNSASASSVKIQGTSLGARVTGATEGELIQVYSIDGVLQRSVNVESETTDIPLAKDKVYIIKAGMKTLKLRM